MAALKDWPLIDPETGLPNSDPNIGIPTFKALETVFSNILNIAVSLAGVVLFIMLIVGGFGYLTASGDPEKLKKAGAVLTSALIGFVLLIASWFILRFISEFTGVDLSTFEIPGV